MKKPSYNLISPGERSWMRLEWCIVDLISTFCGSWPGRVMYEDMAEWDFNAESFN